MKICVYAICKNEINNLDRWYKSASEADYICILDTGSTDGTWEKIQTLPKVISAQKIIKNFNFGEARSESFKLVPPDTDVCLTFDLDEYFPEGWRNHIPEEAKKIPITSWYFTDNDLLRKIISHPYYPELIWKYAILEEPFRKDEKGNYISLWTYPDSPLYISEGLFIYHTPDKRKNRGNYNSLFLKRTEEILNISPEESFESIFQKGMNLIDWAGSVTVRDLPKVEKFKNILRTKWEEFPGKEEKVFKRDYLRMELCFAFLLNNQDDSLKYSQQLENLLQDKIETTWDLAGFTDIYSSKIRYGKISECNLLGLLQKNFREIKNTDRFYLLYSILQMTSPQWKDANIDKILYPVKDYVVSKAIKLKTERKFKPFRLRYENII